jgi:predicted RNA-binding protein YlqC (UPF0109 family)
MFTRILTAKERKRIQAYLGRDGERITAVRQLVSRAKRNLPQINQDIDLLQKLISTYEK